MDQLNIRITHLTEFTGGAIENTFDIEALPKPTPPIGVRHLVVETATTAEQINAAIARRRERFSSKAQATAEPDLVPGEPADMQEALQAISLNLGCQNTLDYILHAIDALRGPQLEWSPTLAYGKTVNFEKAEAAIAALNESLPAGEAQWRMPSRRELESLQDLTLHDPCVDLARYPDTKSGWYWSATPCAWSSGYAWFVSFNYGNSNNDRRGNNNAFVRAVRAVPSGQ